MSEAKRISDELYAQILAIMPIVCVDTILISENQFLLGKRANRPAKGQWFLIGGRIQKGESFVAAVKREVKREVGTKQIKSIKLLTAQDTMFQDSAQGPASHSVNIVHLVEVPYKEYLPPNNENTELRWFAKIDPRWHPYVKKMLRLAGFR